jgi:hypothetical protein
MFQLLSGIWWNLVLGSPLKLESIIPFKSVMYRGIVTWRNLRFTGHEDRMGTSNAYRILVENNFRALWRRYWEQILKIKSSIFCVKTPCSPLKVNRQFGRTCRLHLQGRKIRQARNQSEAGSGPLFFYSSTLTMEATCPSGTSVDFKRPTWRYIPEDGTLHNHRCENPKSGLSNAAPAGAMVPATYFPGARDILSWHPILLCQL